MGIRSIDYYEDMKLVYLSLKKDGYTDDECAKKMFIGSSTLCNWKKKWGVRIRKPIDNEYGITENEYQTGLVNGISRKTVYKRVECGWKIDDAISIPLINNMSERRYSQYGKANR